MQCTLFTSSQPSYCLVEGFTSHHVEVVRRHCLQRLTSMQARFVLQAWLYKCLSVVPGYIVNRLQAIVLKLAGHTIKPRKRVTTQLAIDIKQGLMR